MTPTNFVEALERRQGAALPGRGPSPEARRPSLSARRQPPSPTPERPVRVLAEKDVSAQVVPLHNHVDRTQLLCATRGVMRIVSLRAMWLVPPGKAVVLPARFDHEVHVPRSARLRTVNIDPSRLTNFPDCHVISLGRLILPLVDEVAALPEDYAIGSPHSRLVDVLLDQIQRAPVEWLHLPRPQDARARRIVDEMVSDVANKTTLESWGKQVGASRRTLSRIFEAETGMSFRDYRRQVQIQTSIGLLVDGFSVTRIAGMLGYENPSAFVHAFKSATGVTPGQYTKRLAS
jgi:AraC-like DNA-binding protein